MQKSTLETELEKVYQNALLELHKHTQFKLMILMGDEVELSRQQRQIDWLNDFLHYQQNGANAFHLLFNWAKHLGLRQQIQDFAFFRESIDVFPDLKVTVQIIFINQKCSSAGLLILFRKMQPSLYLRLLNLSYRK